MRKILLNIFLLSFLLSFAYQSEGQIINGNVFLEGNYIKLGLNNNAAFGSSVDPPAGFIPPGADGFNDPICNLGKLGFTADVGRDGWSIGSPPFIGDYFLPGTPEEGWAVSFNGINYNNNRSPELIQGFTDYCVGGTQISGSFTSFSDLPDKQVAIWEGAVNGLGVVKKITLPKDKLYFITEVTLKNLTTTTMNNVYYMRNLDPDNEVAQGSNQYETKNTIEFQNPEPLNKALVSAKGLTYNSYLGLGTIDCRAKVAIGGVSNTVPLVNRIPADVYNGVAPRLSASGATNTFDCAIALAFKLGSLAPGDSVRCAFAYILLQQDLEEALNKTAPQFDINGTIISSGGGYVNCTSSILPINILNGSDYTWTWSPATGLNTTAGPSVIYTPQPVPITYIVNGPDPVCGAATIKLTIYPGNQPLAQFNATNTCGSKIGVFTNQSLTLADSTITYTWDFGDGQTSTQASTNHTYPNFGTYNVTLTVHTSITACGGDTVLTKSVQIRDGSPPSINFASNNACVGRAVLFSGTTNIPATLVASYLWTISGGTTYTTQNISHVFTSPGTYDISLTVTSTSGCITQTTKTINVETDPQVNFTVTNGCATKSITLVNNSTNISGAITQWSWDFGNTTTSNLQNPSLVYNNGGNYTISLVAQTTNGCTGSMNRTVIVESIPIADFTHSPACPRTPVTFNNNSSIGSGNIVSYEWNFDNGNTSTVLNPTTIFNSDRNYRVTLKSTSANGCESPIKTTIVIIKSPLAYAGKDTLVFKNASFTLRSKGGPYYLWSPSIYLDDATKASPIATIAADQVFTLVVTNESGCAATDEVKVRVFVDDDIYVPTMFTPNHDGNNDVFRPTAPTGVVKMFEVFNRWGQPVYRSADPQAGWNGKLGSVEQPAGIYVWFLKAVTRKGELVQKKGTMMLIR